MEAIIFTNGQYVDLDFYRDYLKKSHHTLLICSDGGANTVKKLGIVPDVLIGDMDSVAPETLREYQRAGVLIKKHPTNKDETDTELAVEYCIEKGAKSIVLFGALGNRLDHCFGNLYLLNHLLQKGIEAEIIDEVNRVFLVKDSRVLNVEVGDTVSILSYTDYSDGINLEGFQYPVKNGVMEHFTPGYGISNVAIEKTPKISLKTGILIIDIINEK